MGFLDMKKLMNVLICHVYEDFQVASVIMKIQEDAVDRQKLIEAYPFVTAK